MGSKCCCNYSKGAIDNENELTSEKDINNDAFSKSKCNLVSNDKNNDIMSCGVPPSLNAQSHDLPTSDRYEKDKFINNEKSKGYNHIAEVINEKVKKKKKKKAKEQKKEEKDNQLNSSDPLMNQDTEFNIDNQKQEEYDQFQRTNQSEKFNIKLAMINRDSNYLDTFNVEVYFSNYGNNEQKYTLLGSTDDQNSHSLIGFPEEFSVEYNFEKCQYVKLIYKKGEFWKTVITVNLALVITEQSPEFFVPIDFYKSEQLEINRSMIKQRLQNHISYAQISFQRDEYSKREEECAFFVEFNYISMAFMAKKLQYKIYRLPKKQVSEDKQEIFCSNERFGKSPIYFNPAYLIKKFLLCNIPLYFEFFDKGGIIGDYILDKRSCESLKYLPQIIHFYDSNGINFCDAKVSLLKMSNNHFLDYLKFGLDINFVIGVDYTSSNKDPMNPSSLHSLVTEKNIYEKAIRSCGNIISFYDKSQAYPMFGFGGIPKGKNVLSHCFNVNSQPNPSITGGIDNVIKVYKESLKFVKLLGPTKISEVIKTVLDQIIKHRSMQEEGEARGGLTNLKPKTDLEVGISQFRNLISQQMKGVKFSPKKEIRDKDGKEANLANLELDPSSPRKSSLLNAPPRKSVNTAITAPRKSAIPIKIITSAGNTDAVPFYSPARKPFKCPSLKQLNSPRAGEDQKTAAHRSTIVKKAMRNSIFKDHSNTNQTEDSTFIIPKQERNYTILLIITDGKIDDMQETKNILVQASTLPVSIIIVGVGDANFGNMIELQSEKVMLENYYGQKAERNIVQFVEFSKFQNDEDLLADKVLEKIPKQIEDYYRINGI